MFFFSVLLSGIKAHDDSFSKENISVLLKNVLQNALDENFKFLPAENYDWFAGMPILQQVLYPSIPTYWSEDPCFTSTNATLALDEEAGTATITLLFEGSRADKVYAITVHFNLPRLKHYAVNQLTYFLVVGFLSFPNLFRQQLQNRCQLMFPFFF